MIPAQITGDYLFQMEKVLDLYHEPYDPSYPMVCFDETSKQLLRAIRQALPTAPGQVARYDYEYERNGTANLFMFFEPLRGWRYVKVTNRRTKQEFAYCMRELVDVHYPDATQIRVVLDNLNTHTYGALYDTFPADEAHRLAQRLQFVYTPPHASWLNMAEIELSVLTRQSLDRRIPDQATLTDEIAAWQAIRNAAHATVDWQFSTGDARVKLRKLYPSFQD